MFGQIELENFNGITTMPQHAASAWSGALEQIIGASYKPLLYIGKQQVHGINHYFIAEQSLMTHPPIRRIVKVIICELNGTYELVGVEEI